MCHLCRAVGRLFFFHLSWRCFFFSFNFYCYRCYSACKPPQLCTEADKSQPAAKHQEVHAELPYSVGQPVNPLLASAYFLNSGWGDLATCSREAEGEKGAVSQCER